MGNRKLLVTLFVIVAAIQLAVPGKMIWDRERILETGKEFKFETAPIDPTDPFRGKYIVLSYKENAVKISSQDQFADGENIFVILKKDQNGFAIIKAISKEMPKDGVDFVKAQVGSVSGFPATTLTVSYPFTRFYMEESKAYEAEQAFLKSQRDSTKTTYALVNIKNGKAVLKDVLIDGVSVVDLEKEQRTGNGEQRLETRE